MIARRYLQDVTICAVSSVGISQTARALAKSLAQIDFAEIVWVSDLPCPLTITDVRWVKVDRLAGRRQYSRYILNDLVKHIRTSHALLIQWDGYVLDGNAWDDAFLDTDYIGAVWPQFPAARSVGNGGFSMRSKRLMEAVAALPSEPGRAEDLVICHDMRDLLEKGARMRFATPELACKFSFERIAGQSTFGFHGVFNMPDLLGAEEFLTFYRSLDPRLIGDREQMDLLDIACQKRSPAERALANNILRRVWNEQPMARIAWMALHRLVAGSARHWWRGRRQARCAKVG